MTKKQQATTSNLYEESLLEIDKYKEVAMQEAKRAVLDSITPLIRKQLDINLNSLTEQQTKLFEEEGDPFAVDETQTSEQQPLPPTQTPEPVTGEQPPLPVDNTTPPVAAPAPTDIATTQPEVPTDLPVAVPSAMGLNIPMPGADGKIVVDLSLLLAGSGDLLESPPLTPEQPDLTGGAVDPMSPPPTDVGGFPDPSMTPAPPTEGLESNPFKEWKSRFTKLYSLTESVKTTLGKQTLMEKLSDSQQELIELNQSNKLSSEKFEFYNEFVEKFYNVLKGNINESNIYPKNTEEVMLNKKKSSVAAFAQSLFLSEATHQGFGDGEKPPKGKEELGKDESSKHAMKISGKKPEDPGKAKALVVEEEEVVEEGEEPEVTTEVKQPDGPKDKSEGWTKAKVANKKAKLKEQADMIAKQLQECEQMESSMMTDDMGGSVEERVGNVTLHADNVTIVTSGGTEEDLSGMSDDDELDVVPDEGEESSFGGGDDDVDLGDDTEEDEEPAVKSESLKRLQKEHRELQLVTAQSLYLNKLFAKEGVTLGMKKKITEYMDKAKSLTEAKEVYFKLKGTLDENLGKQQGKGKLVENKGATASSGATPAKKVVSENTTTTHSGPFSTERFMHLAGIAKK